jgi:hypothetical protein
MKIRLLLLLTALIALSNSKGYTQKHLYIIDYDSLKPTTLNIVQIISVTCYNHTYKGKVTSFNDSTLTMLAYSKGEKPLDSIVHFKLDSIHTILYSKMKDSTKIEKLRRKDTAISKFWNLVFHTTVVSILPATFIPIVSSFYAPLRNFTPAQTVASVATYSTLLGFTGIVVFVIDRYIIRKLHYVDFDTVVRLKVK